jgi:hypothetical protein
MKLLKLSLFTASLFAIGTNFASAQNADEIIQKHIDAMGGTENWNKVKAMKMVGSMTAQGMDIDMTLTVANEKGMRTDISLMGQKGYTIVTPKEGWMYMPFAGSDKVTPMPAEMLKPAQTRLNVKNGQLVEKANIAKAEYVGSETINGTNCYKVKVTDKDGSQQTAFIDAATYYMVRVETKAKVQDEEQEIAITYSNFQKQNGGIVYPMTLGSPQGDMVYKTIEVNPSIDDAMFKPAVETKKAEPKK